MLFLPVMFSGLGIQYTKALKDERRIFAMVILKSNRMLLLSILIFIFVF